MAQKDSPHKRSADSGHLCWRWATMQIILSALLAHNKRVAHDTSLVTTVCTQYSAYASRLPVANASPKLGTQRADVQEDTVALGQALAPFFWRTSPSSAEPSSVFLCLPVDVQRLAVHLVAYLPSVPAELRQALAACLRCTIRGSGAKQDDCGLNQNLCLAGGWRSTAPLLNADVGAHFVNVLAAQQADRPTYLAATDDDRLSFLTSVLVGYGATELASVPAAPADRPVHLLPVATALVARGLNSRTDLVANFWVMRAPVIEVPSNASCALHWHDSLISFRCCNY